MNTHAPQVYEQLAWLVESDLPLPEAVQEMAMDLRKASERSSFMEIAEDLRNGSKLADAMRQQPNAFRPLYVQLVEAGETHGFLAEMLHEVGALARFEQTLSHRLRERLAYPCLSLVFGIVVLSGMLYWVVPGFDAMLLEFVGWHSIPPLTMLMLTISRTFQEVWWLVLGVNVALVGLALWLFSQHGEWAFKGLVRMLPGTYGLRRLLDYSRLSAVLSIGLRCQLPLPEALATAASLVETKHLRELLTDWASRSRDGQTLGSMLTDTPDVDQLFALALKHAPEPELASACKRLGDMYRERAEQYLDRYVLFVAGAVVTIVGIGLGLLVVALFTPFIQVINTLAAD